MGLFDIQISKELENDKTVDYLEKTLQKYSNETISREKDTLVLDKFQGEKSFLKYNLNAKKDKFQGKDFLVIDGELQNVWLFVILVILSILLTKGIGILPVILFVYYQKSVNTKFIKELINNSKNLS